nr:protein kinase-like domain, phloem protein 2-like protein [Tanacetum cinerariifolium]
MSPETSCAVYLVYKLPQDRSIFEAPLEIVNCNGRNSAYPHIYLASPLDTPVIKGMLDKIPHNPVNRPKLNAIPQQRRDSWMEVKVWEFQTPANTNTISVHLWCKRAINSVSTLLFVMKSTDIISATNNFDNSRVIGSGGFGKVFKGELSHPEGKIEVAFKRLDRKHGQGDPEFFKEIRMLSSYKHNNLISLLGYCYEGDEMILIYEHASRGSLDWVLNDITLTWRQRLNICIDAAKGLSFLHDPNGTQQRVLHRDIKSANILLDENLNAKVADFGLSKIGPARKQ